MGLYDTIKSSYDLGPGFSKDLQTKDLTRVFDRFWIDPQGRLFKVDYSGTQNWERVPEEERDSVWRTHKTVPSGQHGKVTPHIITHTIEVYPAVWTAHYSRFPRKLLTFVEGVLVFHDKHRKIYDTFRQKLPLWK